MHTPLGGQRSRLWNIPLEELEESPWAGKDLWMSLCPLRDDVNVSTEKRAAVGSDSTALHFLAGREKEIGAGVLASVHSAEFCTQHKDFYPRSLRKFRQNQRSRQAQTPWSR